MGKTIIFVYGVLAYLVFLVACGYSIGFVGDVFVPKSIDSGPSGPIGAALLINSVLLGIFALQHSIMARPAFKRLWTKLIPPAAERSSYVLLSSLLLFLLFWQWRPIPDIVWSVENPIGHAVLLSLYWIGWLLVILSTFLIDHFDFFGLRQVYLAFRGKPYTEIGFKTPSVYKIVRHPIMLGFIIAFWSAPMMSTGRLIFALASTIYILLGMHLEERDLINVYGEAYKEYKSRVFMLIPLPRKKL